jgi:hypothetical protein
MRYNDFFYEMKRTLPQWDEKKVHFPCIGSIIRKLLNENTEGMKNVQHALVLTDRACAESEGDWLLDHNKGMEIFSPP